MREVLLDMGYIKKSVRDKLILMDKDNTMPKKWDKFIDEVKINHNLLIKGRKNLVKCTNCDFEFISKKKIGEYAKCLNCKNTYQIRSNKLKRDYFIDRIILINRIEGELVYRYFEIYSSCNKANNYKVSSSITEFARRFSENHIAVVNERMSKCQGNIYININRLYQYLTKHKGKVDLYLYRDYLRFAKLIGLDLKNKKYVFPDN